MMKAGDEVEITFEGRTIDALIDLISENQRAIFLSFDAIIIAGHIGKMPVLLDKKGIYRSLVNNAPVMIKPKVTQRKTDHEHAGNVDGV